MENLTRSVDPGRHLLELDGPDGPHNHGPSGPERKTLPRWSDPLTPPLAGTLGIPVPVASG